jgi:transposase-like protein
MGSPSKIVQFSEFQKSKSFSPANVQSEKIASPGDSEKTAEAAENIGLAGISGDTASAQFGSKAKSSSSKKVKAAGAKQKGAVKVPPTAGPEGHKLDCSSMTATQLRLAYGGEYTSWRNSKARCKNKKWPWAAEWEAFTGFLLSMGPKPTPAHTLDRIDNAIPAYGPDLCRWADKVTQNNNKGNNHKIVIPVTGEVWTASKLAKLHSVSPKTIYKWISQYYSPLELLAGKKNSPLLALNIALDELPEIITTKAKPPAHKIVVPPMPKLEWDPTPEELEYYGETGKMLDSRYDEKVAEYKAVVTWADRYNAGLPVSPEPPQGKYVKFKWPVRRETQF